MGSGAEGGEGQGSLVEEGADGGEGGGGEGRGILLPGVGTGEVFGGCDGGDRGTAIQDVPGGGDGVGGGGDLLGIEEPDTLEEGVAPLPCAVLDAELDGVGSGAEGGEGQGGLVEEGADGREGGGVEGRGIPLPGVGPGEIFGAGDGGDRGTSVQDVPGGGDGVGGRADLLGIEEPDALEEGVAPLPCAVLNTELDGVGSGAEGGEGQGGLVEEGADGREGGGGEGRAISLAGVGSDEVLSAHDAAPGRRAERQDEPREEPSREFDRARHL